MNKNKKIITGVVAVVVAVGIFFGGVSYGKGQAAATAQTQGTRGNGQFAGRQAGTRGAGGGGFVIGDILSKDATSITVKLRTGGSAIVFTGSSTQVMKSTAGSLDDLSIGSTVMVQGTPNSDGSVTAQSIQIRPSSPQGSATQK